MSYLGVDCAAPVKQDGAQKLVENEVSFIGRYLVPESMWKALTAKEAKLLHDAGLGILLCWELDADRVKKGASAGASDGKRAKELAMALGVPPGTAIYFAVDYSPVIAEYNTIEEYFRAATLACAPYNAGIYGSYYVSEEMKNRIPSLYIWQCVAWSGGNVSPNHNAYQYAGSGWAEAVAMKEKVGFAVDLDSSEDIYSAGLWLPEQIRPQPEPEPAPAPWYAEHMAWAEKHGLINDGRPDDPVTRAELATVLHRAFGDTWGE